MFEQGDKVLYADREYVVAETEPLVLSDDRYRVMPSRQAVTLLERGGTRWVLKVNSPLEIWYPEFVKIVLHGREESLKEKFLQWV